MLIILNFAVSYDTCFVWGGIAQFLERREEIYFL